MVLGFKQPRYVTVQELNGARIVRESVRFKLREPYDHVCLCNCFCQRELFKRLSLRRGNFSFSLVESDNFTPRFIDNGLNARLFQQCLVRRCGASTTGRVPEHRYRSELLNQFDCRFHNGRVCRCLLYTSDAADEEDSVDLGGRRIIKKKKKKE